MAASDNRLYCEQQQICEQQPLLHCNYPMSRCTVAFKINKECGTPGTNSVMGRTDGRGS